MAIRFLIAGLILGFQALAQPGIPGHFLKAEAILFDGTYIKGHIKDDFKKNPYVIIMAENGIRKHYSVELIRELTVDTNSYICVKGDLFKVVNHGNISLVQKMSDMAGRIVGYNGSEAIISNGTEGSINDFFYYTKRSKTLSLINKKKFTEIISTVFAGCVQITNNILSYSFTKEQFIALSEQYDVECNGDK